MTDNEAITLIENRAKALAADPKVQKIVLDKGFKSKNEVQKFIYGLAIATLYGKPI